MHQSPKSEVEVLATLKAIVGKHAADSLGELGMHTERNPDDEADACGQDSIC